MISPENNPDKGYDVLEGAREILRMQGFDYPQNPIMPQTYAQNINSQRRARVDRQDGLALLGAGVGSVMGGVLAFIGSDPTETYGSFATGVLLAAFKAYILTPVGVLLGASAGSVAGLYAEKAFFGVQQMCERYLPRR